MATIQIDTPASPLRENSGEERKRVKKRRRQSRSCVQWWTILPPTYKFFILLIFLSVLLVGFLYLQKLAKHIQESVDNETNSTAKFIPNPEIALPPSASKLHLFKKGAVCSDSEICSKIGSNVLDSGGNVVDAAIATLFCNGIATAQSLGIFGGCIINLYIHKERKAYTLNAKDIAPIAATPDMFKSFDEYTNGPLSIATPGEVKGYWELHKKFGSMPWKDLMEPAIKVCEEGFIVSKHMSDFIDPKLVNDTHLGPRLFNNETKLPLKAGEHARLAPQLCNTYKILAEKGGDDFYNGGLADLIAEDLQDVGSIITKKDLEKYKVRWSDSIPVKMDENTVYVTPPLSGGPLIAFVLNVLRGYNFTPESIATEEETILTYHRIIEAYKYAFGLRTQLNDPEFENVDGLLNNMTSPEFAEQIRQQINDNQTDQDPKHYGGTYDVVDDKGTSHMSILAPNGDAISVTSSINFYFGIGATGKRTGIIFNTGMNDFSVPKLKNLFELPAWPGNYIKPLKRAMTSMSPTIITDQNGDVKLVIGSAGGTKIPTAVTSVIVRTLWLGQSLKEAIDAPRIHHQLWPMRVEYEYGNTQNIVDGLEKIGHKMHRFHDRGSVICAIAKNATGVYGNADYRKAGEVIGL